MTAVMTGAPHGQTETGAQYAEHAQGRALSPADLTVGMTISLRPGQPAITIYSIFDGESFRYIRDGEGKTTAVSLDAWCALVVAA